MLGASPILKSCGSGIARAINAQSAANTTAESCPTSVPCPTAVQKLLVNEQIKNNMMNIDPTIPFSSIRFIAAYPCTVVVLALAKAKTKKWSLHQLGEKIYPILGAPRKSAVYATIGIIYFHNRYECTHNSIASIQTAITNYPTENNIHRTNNLCCMIRVRYSATTNIISAASAEREDTEYIISAPIITKNSVQRLAASAPSITAPRAVAPNRFGCM